MAIETGLEGVVVAETALSDVDGERGRLVVRGFDVESLAERARFEDVHGLLSTGRLPSDAEREGIRAGLGRGRADAWKHMGSIGDALRVSDGMDAVRTAVAHLQASGDHARDAESLLGGVAVFAAAWARVRDGAEPIAPDAHAWHAADFARTATGSTLDAPRVAALERYLVTVADHGMNASTFTARVVTSTGSDAVSAAVSAICALKGPLHGGAPGPVLDMLDAIGAPDQATAWLEGELAAGRRIMGMGHRIYRVRDPRAAVFERALEQLEQAGVTSGRLALARAVERAAVGVLRARHPTRPLHANVEFYTAVLLDAVGLPRALFSPTFAVGRMAGWMAHVAEQRSLARLIRPASNYVGPRPADERVAAS